MVAICTGGFESKARSERQGLQTLPSTMALGNGLVAIISYAASLVITAGFGKEAVTVNIWPKCMFVGVVFKDVKCM